MKTRIIISRTNPEKHSFSLLRFSLSLSLSPYPSVSHFLCVFLSLSLFWSPSLSSSLCLSIYLSLFISLCLSLRFSLPLFHSAKFEKHTFSPFFPLSASLSFRLSFSPSVSPFLFLSVSRSVSSSFSLSYFIKTSIFISGPNPETHSFSSHSLPVRLLLSLSPQTIQHRSALGQKLAQHHKMKRTGQPVSE